MTEIYILFAIIVIFVLLNQNTHNLIVTPSNGNGNANVVSAEPLINWHSVVENRFINSGGNIPNGIITVASNEECRQQCEEDILCGGWTSKGNTCWMKNIGHTGNGAGDGWAYQLNDRTSAL